MYDLSPLQPFLIGFFVLAAVATALAVATLFKLAAESRRPARPVVAVSAALPAAAAGAQRAA